MSILSVGERVRDRVGERDDEGVAERELLIVTDGTDTVEDVLISGQVPQKGESDPKNAGRVVRDVDVDEYGESGNLFTARVSYSTLAVTTYPAGSPLLKPAIRRWAFNGGTTLIRRGVFLGNVAKSLIGTAPLVAGSSGIADYPVLNSALEPFDNVPDDAPGAAAAFTFQKNELTFDAGYAMNYFRAVNADSFLGALPGQCRIDNIAAAQVTESGLTFWQIAYEFQFRREGWLLTLLDAGLNEAPDLGDVTKAAAEQLRRRPIIGSNGVAVTDPQPLNGYGQLLQPDAAGLYDFVYRRWQYNAERPFAPLGITGS